MSEKDIVIQARALLAGATPGPWVVRNCSVEGPVTPTGKMGTVAVAVRPTHERAVDSPTAPANAALIAHAPELLRALADEVDQLRELVVHMHVHSGYRNNGYMQMTTEQKALYDAIWERSVAELDTEEGSHAKP